MLKFWKKREPETGDKESEARKPPDLAAPVESAPANAESSKKSWRERFARSVFNRDIRDLFARHPQLDDALLDELETLLIGADVGVAASTELIESLRRRMDQREFADAVALLAALRGELIVLLTP